MSSGFAVLRLNWMFPIQLPPRASRFWIHSRYPPSLNVCDPLIQVNVSRTDVTQSSAVTPSRSGYAKSALSIEEAAIASPNETMGIVPSGFSSGYH